MLVHDINFLFSLSQILKRYQDSTAADGKASIAAVETEVKYI